MDIRTFSKQCDLVYLGSALSADYTQSWSKILSDCDRVVYLALGHASIAGNFNVQIADDASGTNPVSVQTNIAMAAGKAETIEIGPGDLTPAKQFVSALATRSAGTFSLVRMKFSLRHPGEFTADTTWAHQVGPST